MFAEITAFRCKKCRKVYIDDKPEVCGCQTTLEEGKLIGSFLLQKKLEERNWSVICLLCGLETKVSATNMKRQKSCGCKPKHCELTKISDSEARYRCRKCGTSYTESTPILFWCCSEEEV